MIQIFPNYFLKIIKKSETRAMEIGSEILIKIKKITLRISTDSSVPSSYRTYGSGFTQIGYLEKKFYQAGSPGGVKKDSETEYN